MDVVPMAGWVWSLGVAVWWSGCGGMAFAAVALARSRAIRRCWWWTTAPAFCGGGRQTATGARDFGGRAKRTIESRWTAARVLRAGETPVSVGGGGRPTSGTSTVLFANGQGHFITQERVNDHTVTFMVDTGASSIALKGRSDGQRAGIKHGDGKGQEVRIHRQWHR